MTLTSKQEAFSQAIVTGMNQSDAYRSAYNASNTKPDVVNVKASQVMANGKVAVRVRELQSALAEKSLWTREQSVTVLKGVIEELAGKSTDKISAVKVLNDMQGFNAPAKLDVTATTITRIELVPMRANSSD